MIGRPARVLLAAWIIERGDEPFFQQEVAMALAASHQEALSAITHELSRFSAWGMLIRSEPGGSQRKVWYDINKEHPAWALWRCAATCFGLLPTEE